MRTIQGFSQRVIDNPDVLNRTLVYAVFDSFAIKIGKCTCHPTVRVKQLQTANPTTLYLLAYTSTLTEKKAHRLFNKYRIRGEWFELTAEVLEELKTWDWVDKERCAKIQGSI